MILSFLHALPNDPHLPTSPYMEIEMGGGVAGGYVDNGLCVYIAAPNNHAVVITSSSQT